MSRVPAIPFRVRIMFRHGNNNVALPDQWHTAATMAGVIEYRTKALASPNTWKVETYLLIDETSPRVEQKEPARTIVSSDGNGPRTSRTFQNSEVNRVRPQK